MCSSCFVVWVTSITNDKKFLKTIISRFILDISLKEKIKIYVTAKPRSLANRRDDTPPSFVFNQLQLYEKIAKSINAFKIDTTNKNEHETLKIVYNFITSSPEFNFEKE